MPFNKTAIGIFGSETQVDQAISQLLQDGFQSADISALIPRRSGADLTLEKHTKAPEGAVVGASAGAVAVGIAATLVGIGAITIPGLGVLLAAGPIVAALTGAAAGAAVGGLGGALIGLGIPEIEAKRYAERVANGDLLVAVHTETAEDLDRARELLENWGAREVAAVGEKSLPRHKKRVARDDERATRRKATPRSVPPGLREEPLLHDEPPSLRDDERALRDEERALGDGARALREDDTGRWTP